MHAVWLWRLEAARADMNSPKQRQPTRFRLTQWAKFRHECAKARPGMISITQTSMARMRVRLPISLSKEQQKERRKIVVSSGLFGVVLCGLWALSAAAPANFAGTW